MLSRKAPFPSLITRNSRNHMILMKGKIGIMIRNYMQLQLYRVLCGNLKVHVSRTPPWDSFIDYNLINSFNQPSYYDSGKRNCISIILFSDMPKLFCCEPLGIDSGVISGVSCHALMYAFFLTDKCAVLNAQTHNLDSVECKAASGCPSQPYIPSELWKCKMILQFYYF